MMGLGVRGNGRTQHDWAMCLGGSGHNTSSKKDPVAANMAVHFLLGLGWEWSQHGCPFLAIWFNLESSKFSSEWSYELSPTEQNYHQCSMTSSTQWHSPRTWQITPNTNSQWTHIAILNDSEFVITYMSFLHINFINISYLSEVKLYPSVPSMYWT